MAHYLKGEGDPKTIINAIKDKVLNSSISGQLLHESYDTFNDIHIALLVFEKYYMRAKNRVSLSIQVVAQGEDIDIRVVGSGGGQGPIFKLSWGSEEDFEETVVSMLRRAGYQ